MKSAVVFETIVMDGFPPTLKYEARVAAEGGFDSGAGFLGNRPFEDSAIGLDK